MNNSHTFQTNTRTAMAARDVLSKRGLGAVVALILLSLLATGLLVGSPPSHALEPAETTEAAITAKPAMVNINTADAQTLASNLHGVGESRAAEIVRYREAYGPFTSAEELMEVKGIGKATLDMNRNVITLE